MISRCTLAALTMIVFSPILFPCAAMDLGLFIGTHSASAYVSQWYNDDEILMRLPAVVGVQTEQRFGSAVTGLRVGVLGSYALSAQTGSRFNEYRGSLLGADARVFLAIRKELLPDVLWAHAGPALAYDWYEVTFWGRKYLTTGTFTQSLAAGLRVKPGGRWTAAADLDLNLAREGQSQYHYDDDDPRSHWAYRLGTMEPSLTLGALLSL